MGFSSKWPLLSSLWGDDLTYYLEKKLIHQIGLLESSLPLSLQPAHCFPPFQWRRCSLLLIPTLLSGLYIPLTPNFSAPLPDLLGLTHFLTPFLSGIFHIGWSCLCHFYHKRATTNQKAQTAPSQSNLIHLSLYRHTFSPSSIIIRYLFPISQPDFSKM